jgi:hypothetical protein
VQFAGVYQHLGLEISGVLVRQDSLRLAGTLALPITIPREGERTREPNGLHMGNTLATIDTFAS